MEAGALFLSSVFLSSIVNQIRIVRKSIKKGLNMSIHETLHHITCVKYIDFISKFFKANSKSSEGSSKLKVGEIMAGLRNTCLNKLRICMSLKGTEPVIQSVSVIY